MFLTVFIHFQVIVIFLVILEPVAEVEGGGDSRLVIHTPQRVKTIHKYHTSEVYAKEFGHGEWYFRNKKPKGFRWGRPSHKPSSHRVRYRKGNHRKVGGGRVPFTSGKSYGMSNYAKNYRNWSPTRRPVRRYRDSYMNLYNSQESHENSEDNSSQMDYSEQEQEEDEYSSIEPKPSFGNAIKEIDYYAKRNRDFARGSIYDSISKSGTSRNGGRHRDTNYPRDSYTGSESHAETYSTLPDEFVNPPRSNVAKGFQSNASNSYRGQHFRPKNQSRRQIQSNNSNYRKNYNFNNNNYRNRNNNNRHNNRNYNNHNDNHNNYNTYNDNSHDRYKSSFENEGTTEFSTHSGGRQNDFNNYEANLGHDPYVDPSPGRKGNRFSNQNYERDQEPQFNNHDSSYKREGNHNFRGESGDRHNDQYSSAANHYRYNEEPVNIGHGTSFASGSFGPGSEYGFTTKGSEYGFTTNFEHSENIGNNFKSVQDSHFSGSDHFNTQQQATRHDFSFDKGTVLHDTVPSHTDRTLRESNGGIETEISITTSRPQNEDAYFKAFRAFSFRKGSSPTSVSGRQVQTNSASASSNPSSTQNRHNLRNIDQWTNYGPGHRVNNDHDIGFLEGLEDINDGI
ncbi:hypothetical protein L9F63_007530 [Diploptera punctata]|uniref:Uncharacterized protein n=1 Tax=Diploptera punctata TaxID=6984 RepID=A0AAD7Z899_DIPPU|nr:hypothetical protein L9F63_007530 [Diploptera punctata]